MPCATEQVSQDLLGWWFTMHLTCTGLGFQVTSASSPGLIMLIQQMPDALIPLTEVLTRGHFSLGVPPWDHLLNGSLDISRRVRLEGSLMKDLVCLWDRSALTRNIPSCLVNRSEIWAALHGQYYERNARQFSLGWWAPVLLQYSENLPFEPVFFIAWLSR